MMPLGLVKKTQKSIIKTHGLCSKYTSNITVVGFGLDKLHEDSPIWKGFGELYPFKSQVVIRVLGIQEKHQKNVCKTSIIYTGHHD
jgi:hypothetical protein